MIIVRIQLYSAVTGKTTEIGKMRITNVGGHVSDTVGNYTVEVFRRGSTSTVQRHGIVEGYPRKSYNVWRLIIRALKSTFPEEK